MIPKTNTKAGRAWLIGVTGSQNSILKRSGCILPAVLVLLLVLLAPGTRSQAAPAGPMFIVGSATGQPGQEVLVPVTVNRFTNIMTFQFSLHWDPTQATFVDVEQFGLPQLTAVANFFSPTPGVVTVSWEDQISIGQNLPAGATIYAVRLQLTGSAGTISSLFINGSPTIVEVSLGDGQLVTPSLVGGQLSITAPNATPVLTPIGSKTVNEGTLLSFINSATDVDLPAQTLTYSLDAGAPSGASINPSTGTFTWTPTEAQGPGSYPVTIRVTDNGSPVASAFETITITVNEVNLPPVLASIGNKSVNEGSLLTFTASATDADLPAQTLIFTLDAGAPAGASIDPSTGEFTWTPTEAQGPGSFPVTVRVTDNGSPSGSASETITITVNEVNLVPVLTSIGNKSINEGSQLNFTAAATDPDLPAQTLTFTLDAGAPAGASINPGTGTFTWTPTEAQGPGSYPVTVRVTDNGSPSGSASETITITVNEVNLAPVLASIGNKSINEGSPLTFTATATDPDLPAQSLTFTLDAGAPAGVSINPGTGTFTWTPTEAQGPGSYPVTIRVTDNGSPVASAFETITITVNEVNLPPVLGSIGNKSVNEGSELTFTATATDADLPAQTLTFTLDAGAPAGASIDPSTGGFTWTPTEAQGPGSFPVTIRVTDSGSPAGSASETITITVNEVNRAPVLSSIGNKTVNEGSALTLTATATDSDLPAQTLTFTLDAGAPAGASINPSTGAFAWTPTEAQGPGSFPVTIRVTDNGSPAMDDSQTITITVNEVNRAPVLGSIGNKTVNEGSALTFTATATDADLPAQTLTFTLDAGAPTGASINPGTGAFAWTPTEAQGPGSYQVTVRVTDNSSPALSDFQTFTITVNEVNEPPALAPIGNKTTFDGSVLTFAVTATDPDLPEQVLTCSLGAGAPAGASITTNGLFAWALPVGAPPSTHNMSVVVSDSGSPPLSATQSFTITVLKTNHAPVFAPLSDYVAQVLLPLRVTNVVTDPDIPTNRVTFEIASAPKGARINKFSGVVAWAPSRSQARSTNWISVLATDDGTPPLSATNSFQVIVDDYLELSLGTFVVRSGQSGSVPIAVTNTTTVTNVSASLFVPADQLTNLALTGLAGVGAGTLTPQGLGASKLSFAAADGQNFQPAQSLGQLDFTAISARSAFIPLLVSNVIAIQSNGVPVNRTLASAGRVVVVADQPLVEALSSTNLQPLLMVYGLPGWTNVVQATEDPLGNSNTWQTAWEGTLTNLFQVVQPTVPTNTLLFFRSFRR